MKELAIIILNQESGINGSGTILLIDMDTRVIYIFSNGEILRKVSSARADEVTVNIYRYASNEDYLECGKVAFNQINQRLQGKFVFSYLRLFTSIGTGICTFLLVCIIIVCNQRKHKCQITDLTLNQEEYRLIRRDTLINRTKSVHHNSSSGGHSGGGGGGGGHSF